jgi:hypothetical protein
MNFKLFNHHSKVLTLFNRQNGIIALLRPDSDKPVKKNLGNMKKITYLCDLKSFGV